MINQVVHPLESLSQLLNWICLFGIPLALYLFTKKKTILSTLVFWVGTPIVMWAVLLLIFTELNSYSMRQEYGMRGNLPLYDVGRGAEIFLLGFPVSILFTTAIYGVGHFLKKLINRYRGKAESKDLAEIAYESVQLKKKHLGSRKLKHKIFKIVMCLSLLAGVLLVIFYKNVVIEETGQVQSEKYEGSVGDLISLKITNNGFLPVYYIGYGKSFPLCVSSEKNSKGIWVDRNEKFCGTGAKEWKLNPGESISFTGYYERIPNERKVGIVFESPTYKYDSSSLIWSVPIKQP